MLLTRSRRTLAITRIDCQNRSVLFWSNATNRIILFGSNKAKSFPSGQTQQNHSLLVKHKWHIQKQNQPYKLYQVFCRSIHHAPFLFNHDFVPVSSMCAWNGWFYCNLKYIYSQIKRAPLQREKREIRINSFKLLTIEKSIPIQTVAQRHYFFRTLNGKLLPSTVKRWLINWWTVHDERWRWSKMQCAQCKVMLYGQWDGNSTVNDVW